MISALKALFDLQNVETEDRAVRILRAVGWLFIFYTVTNVFIYRDLYRYGDTISTVAVFVVLGYAIAGHQSRVAASLLFLLEFATFTKWIIDLFSAEAHLSFLSLLSHGVVLLFIYIAIRGLQASFSYHKIIGSKLNIGNIFILNLCAIIYFVLFRFIYSHIIWGLVISKFLSGEPPPDLSFVAVATHQVPLWLILLGTLSLTYKGWLPFTRNRAFIRL